MKVPGLKRILTHWPSAGQSTTVAAVSGPRSVRKLFPPNRVIAISKLLVSCDRGETVRTIAVAAPNPFNKRLTGGPFFEMDELARSGTDSWPDCPTRHSPLKASPRLPSTSDKRQKKYNNHANR